MGKSFSFAGLDISSGFYRITETDVFSNPDREVKAIELARADGSEAVFDRYKDRSITMAGIIKNTTSDLVEAQLDTLKQYVQATGALDVGYAGGIRRWPNTKLQNLIVTRDAGDITQMGVSYNFYAPKAWALDTTQGQLVTNPTTITAASNSYAVNVAGSYPALPIYTFTINSISVTSSWVLILSNTAESRFLTITIPAPAAGGVLVVDCVNTLVTYNSTPVRATGRYPVFAPLSGTLGISDNGAARNLTLAAPYDKRYL